MVAESLNKKAIEMITLAEPVLGNEEKEALCAVIDSGWLAMGDRVASFERSFAHLHSANDAVAVSSCTAALHLCLKALGIGRGDQVLVPSLTFVATVNAVLYVNAEPVFVDIVDVCTPHMSLHDAEAKCTSRTKAVIVMHYGGYLVDLHSWRAFADKKRLFLIEDAAHAPAVGEVGRLSDASAFSFFSNKNMSTAEGGMVIAKDSDVLERIRRMRGHAMTTNTLDRDRGHAYSYDVNMLGYNYRMDELRASMGLVQLVHLPEWNRKRRELTELYRESLSALVPEVQPPFSQIDGTAAHLMPVLLPAGENRERIMSQLRDAGIQSSIHYPPVHQFSYFHKRFPKVFLTKTEEFCARELSLPLHPSLTENDIAFVVQSLKEVID